MNTTSYAYYDRNSNSINPVMVYYSPKPVFKKQDIKWFDDSKLIRKSKEKM